MRDAMARILKAARDAGVAPGIHVVHPPVDEVRELVAEGFRFIAYCGDMLLMVPAAGEAGVSLSRLQA